MFRGPFLLLVALYGVEANPDARRLFEDILADYNKLVRPVNVNNETLIVKFKLYLSQLLDVHEKNQIMTTNVWLEHTWTDYKLMWNPDDYGGVEQLHVPSELIWLPDVVLYNNADGNYQVQILTKAYVSYNGTVKWKPPAIYKSMCQIDVLWFPFDIQECEMIFGSWTYGGLEVDLMHTENATECIDPQTKEVSWAVQEGIDLEEMYDSVEWDILAVPALRNSKKYNCCDSPFIDITCVIKLRRKTLFYMVNLVIPCMGISFLTALVFYLPSDSGEKISLCISILVALTVYFLVLVETIPSTSLAIPLIAKYLLFTMVSVTLSVVVTVITLNVHHRSPSSHTMPWIVRRFMIEILPRVLRLTRPAQPEPQELGPEMKLRANAKNSKLQQEAFFRAFDSLDRSSPEFLTPDIFKRVEEEPPRPTKVAVESVCFIADHMRTKEEDDQVVEDWKYVAMVMDRLFLWVFTILSVSGTAAILLQAPSIYADIYPKAPAIVCPA